MVDWWRYLISHIIPRCLISILIENTPPKTSSHLMPFQQQIQHHQRGFNISIFNFIFHGLNAETAIAHARIRLQIIFSYPPYLHILKSLQHPLAFLICFTYHHSKHQKNFVHLLGLTYGLPHIPIASNYVFNVRNFIQYIVENKKKQGLRLISLVHKSHTQGDLFIVREVQLKRVTENK